MPGNAHSLTLDDAEALFRGRMGLIYGPGITCEPSFFTKLANDLAMKLNVQSEQTFLHNAQLALDQGADADDVKKVILEALKSCRAFPHLKKLANVKWSAVCLRRRVDACMREETLWVHGHASDRIGASTATQDDTSIQIARNTWRNRFCLFGIDLRCSTAQVAVRGSGIRRQGKESTSRVSRPRRLRATLS
jgi:hypothetical protein